MERAMNLLNLAKEAKQRITEKNTWTIGARHKLNESGKGASVCALGAIEDSVGVEDGEAENDSLARELIYRMGRLLGVDSYKDWKDARFNVDKDDYLAECVEVVESFNDNGTQRRVHGLFTRVATVIRREYAERRQKRLARQIMRDAIASAKKTPAKQREREGV